MSESVKILDAGEKLLLSGQEAADVEAKLQYYVGRGSVIVSPLARIGSAWVAACTPPLQEADRSSTLGLARIREAQQAAKPAPRGEPESDGVCSVERIGLKRLITGPTLAAVQAITERFLELGAGIETEPAEVFGQWSAVCDMGGRKEP